MSQSISNLADNLAELKKILPDTVLIKRFYNTYQFCHNDIDKFKLSLRKGVYPYEYMGSWKKFKEPVPLTKETYYSEFNDTHISDGDIEHVKNVCDAFNLVNLGDYHDHYVSLDVSLLADVFENFRDTTIDIDKLHSVYHLSAPGLSWQSCLKKTGVTLELLTDENMLLLFEKGIRSGMCNVVNKYAKANNKYMKNYDNTKESMYLMYVDANNLYGWAMSKKLPNDGFTWEQDLSIFTEDFIKNYDKNSDKGYLIYADITYPKDIRELYADLPFSPDKMQVNKVNKLVVSVYDKNYYVINAPALKQALNHGLMLNKVHEVISFRQDAWLKPYIDMNTKLRMQAKNDFAKDYFKLKNNAAYGKTTENIRKHRDIHVITNDKKRTILASESNYHATKHILNDLLIMEMKKRDLYMNKPIYLGQAILDISKTLMYEFWYDYIKPIYGNNVKLCYMDTDSFVMLIKADDFYADISNDVKKWFDTSNFDKNDNRPLLIGENKKVIGKFKDELGGKIISEFCGLKAKTYSYKLDDDSEVEKTKGTKRCVVKRHINFDNNTDILFKDKKLLRSQFTFKSDHHTICSQKINKIALNYFDDKRLQCNDKITTYPYGYFDNEKDINIEIKDNTAMLNAIENSGVIPKNYNTKDSLKKDIANAPIDINKIIDANSDNSADSGKSACIDIIKSTNANSMYVDSIKSTCNDNIKNTTITYANNANSTCIDIIKSINVKISYLDSIKSSNVDIIKSTNVNHNYLDNIKSTCEDKITIKKALKPLHII